MRFLEKVTKKTSELVSSAIIKVLAPNSGKVKARTFDNSQEFSNHTKKNEALESVNNFSEPVSNWQRRSNEDLNRLVQQYIPKKKLLSTITHNELAIIQDRLNNRSRNRLGIKAFNAVFWD